MTHVDSDRPTYEAYALRYASREGDKATEFFRFDAYQEPNEEVRIDYFFWLIRGHGRIILVDCGFDENAGLDKGRAMDNHPLRLLESLGISADQVDHVVISHMHFDHVGNLLLFPNAEFTMGRAEFDFWTGPRANRAIFEWALPRAALDAVQELNAAGRLTLVDGPHELLPGVTVTPMGGHTPGLLVTEVSAGSGQVILASDAVHSYEELDLDRPYNLFNDIEQVYSTYDSLRALDARADSWVVPGHDPLVRRYFDSVHHPDCFDLTVPPVRPSVKSNQTVQQTGTPA
ncbi:N-acyl homoserine lactonase family protein [Rhodococcus sp. NPDC127530]|uniref:N-acyl homoserine lactonase family protein n=1 Tax=unclassified Rhodococcus (in: high G+C Gram-positive bacteria) TaxID=192944 RepID=UPI0036455B50